MKKILYAGEYQGVQGFRWIPNVWNNQEKKRLSPRFDLFLPLRTLRYRFLFSVAIQRTSSENYLSFTIYPTNSRWQICGKKLRLRLFNEYPANNLRLEKYLHDTFRYVDRNASLCVFIRLFVSCFLLFFTYV